jgi:hypothetical protein
MVNIHTRWMYKKIKHLTSQHHETSSYIETKVAGEAPEQ